MKSKQNSFCQCPSRSIVTLVSSLRFPWDFFGSLWASLASSWALPGCFCSFLVSPSAPMGAQGKSRDSWRIRYVFLWSQCSQNIIGVIKNGALRLLEESLKGPLTDPQGSPR